MSDLGAYGDMNLSDIATANEAADDEILEEDELLDDIELVTNEPTD